MHRARIHIRERFARTGRAGRRLPPQPIMRRGPHAGAPHFPESLTLSDVCAALPHLISRIAVSPCKP